MHHSSAITINSGRPSLNTCAELYRAALTQGPREVAHVVESAIRHGYTVADLERRMNALCSPVLFTSSGSRPA